MQYCAVAAVGLRYEELRSEDRHCVIPPRLQVYKLQLTRHSFVSLVVLAIYNIPPPFLCFDDDETFQTAHRATAQEATSEHQMQQGLEKALIPWLYGTMLCSRGGEGWK